MPAEEAVFTAAVSRDEVRKSLARMEYHLSRGPAGLRGVNREQAFLNALGRQSARLGAKTAAGVNVSAKAGLGTRARAAMIAQANGNSAQAGRLKSSLLSEYSQDTMSGSREWTYDGKSTWIWTTNASACPACLDAHGKRFTGPFTPMHPSCLCFPQPADEAAANGVKQLTSRELIDTLRTSNNPAFARVGNLIRSGAMTSKQAANDAVRRSAKGIERWQRALAQQAERAAGDIVEVAPVVVEAAPTIVEEVPTVAEAAASVKELVEESLTWLDDMEAGATRITFKAKRHAQTIREAVEHLDTVVDSPEFKAALNRVIAKLDEFATFSNSQSRWAGRFTPPRKKFRTNPVTGERETFKQTGGKIEMQMRGQVGEEVERWNEAVKIHNQRVRDAFDVRQRLGPDHPDYQALIREIGPGPNKKDFTFAADRDAVRISETLLHEVIHAMDDQLEHALANNVISSGAREEVRAIFASSTDPNAKAFWYAAEKGLGGGRGHETVAELGRMYFTGTGNKATEMGIDAITATEWRATYPRLAKWVEDNILTAGESLP